MNFAVLSLLLSVVSLIHVLVLILELWRLSVGALALQLPVEPSFVTQLLLLVQCSMIVQEFRMQFHLIFVQSLLCRSMLLAHLLMLVLLVVL